MKGDSSPLGRGDAALSEDDFLDVMEGREGVADISFESTVVDSGQISNVVG